MKAVKLSKWAAMFGLSKHGAYVMYKRGDIPNAFALPTGLILVNIEDQEKQILLEKVAIYARVSTAKQKDDLDRQVVRLTDFCAAKGWKIDIIKKEIASGLNDNRKELNALMEQHITKLVVEHKDRLTRFGYNYLERYFKSRGGEIIIINNVEDGKEDLMQDFISIITSMTARIYGLRQSTRRTEKLIAELKNE